jgi:hypothetical protein
MISREDLKDWVIEALKAHGGKASVFEVCKHIWTHHESQLRTSRRLLYTWQYDVRWAAQHLRDSGKMKPVHGSKSRPWELA